MPLRLETPRIILRPFEDRDIEPFSRYRSDPDVARYQGWDAPYTIEQAARFVEEMNAAKPGAPGEWYQVAVEIKATGELAGDCAFQCITSDRRQAEIGCTLAQEFQGQGYGKEAVTRLLDYLFGELGLHRVRANTDPANHASIRLLRSLGLRHEGRFVQSLWIKGAWEDEDWYALLKSEWDSRP